jgi:hypothetical protein
MGAAFPTPVGEKATAKKRIVSIFAIRIEEFSLTI